MSDSRTQTTLEHSLQKPLQTSFCYPNKNEGFLEGRLSESRSAVQLAVLVCKQVSEMQYMTKKDQNLDERDDRKRPESGMLNMLNLFNCMNVDIGRCQPWRSTFNAFGVACSLEQSLLQSPFLLTLDMLHLRAVWIIDDHYFSVSGNLCFLLDEFFFW